MSGAHDGKETRAGLGSRGEIENMRVESLIGGVLRERVEFSGGNSAATVKP
jgi:hypothetical protein